MKKCMFDKARQVCQIMEVSNHQKENYCHQCKSKCEDELDLIRRYVPIIELGYGSSKQRFLNEFRKYANRNIKLMTLSVTKDHFNNAIESCNHNYITLANIIGIKTEYLVHISLNGATSYEVAALVADELNCDICTLFHPTSFR